VPKGFSISIFAKDTPGARVLAFDPNGTLLVSLTSKGEVVALPDKNNDREADDMVIVAEGLNLPHGIAFNPITKKLYIAETNGVSIYDYSLNTFIAINKKKIIDLPGSGNHFSRTIGFGLDGKLYVAIGSTCNVCNESDNRRAKIFIANADGSDFHVFASGLRNTVFFAWHPLTHELWGNDMGRDLLGDDIPPDEVNILKQGKFYGWPYCYGKQIHDENFDNSVSSKQLCQTSEPSHIDLQAHSAPLGLAFVPANSDWPKEYWNNLLVSYHGSWNRSVPTGYKIVRIKLDGKGNYVGTEDFIYGWLDNGGAVGRPVDLLFDRNGQLFVSDDKAGAIYKITVGT
jgi:glucose/arabinose dehydrogenase